MQQNTGFHEVRFPTDVSFGSSGGPERSTEIVTLGSGREHRNQRWARSRRRYDAGYGIKNLDALHAVLDFYEARRGPLYGFRFRDPLDWKSCEPLNVIAGDDQLLGLGDGVLATFNLVKNYGDGDALYVRPIEKPHLGSVIVMVDGGLQQPGVHYTHDETTGSIVFDQAFVPPQGSQITAGFEFDVPVRFASDQLTISIAAFKAGDVPSIPMLEIRL